MMMTAVFGKPEKLSIYRRQFVHEAVNLGLNSLGIVAIISVFMGAVITLQTAAMLASWMPDYALGYTTRQSTILEFSPTVVCLILAGKVGSNIASEIGTMRVTEQIDALEIMGVNSRGYLILPKMLGAMMMFPVLVVFSMVLSLFGGWAVCELTGYATTEVYIKGIRSFFEPFSVTYALVKTVVFAYVITTISSYYGYYTQGGALEVGRSSTKAVVSSSIFILLSNYIITQVMLM
jgi:phospholipid/cholesterol/gamma-HCH transport system permease protein